MQNLQYKRTSMSFKRTLVYSLIADLVGILEFDTICYSSNALVNFKVCSLKKKKQTKTFLHLYFYFLTFYLFVTCGRSCTMSLTVLSEEQNS